MANRNKHHKIARRKAALEGEGTASTSTVNPAEGWTQCAPLPSTSTEPMMPIPDDDSGAPPTVFGAFKNGVGQAICTVLKNMTEINTAYVNADFCHKAFAFLLTPSNLPDLCHNQTIDITAISAGTSTASSAITTVISPHEGTPPGFALGCASTTSTPFSEQLTECLTNVATAIVTDGIRPLTRDQEDSLILSNALKIGIPIVTIAAAAGAYAFYRHRTNTRTAEAAPLLPHVDATPQMAV